jgi:hypothetical protein
MTTHHLGSSVLLAGGVVLVFAGLSTALGFSVSGMFASAGAIAALLYAGGVWFGAAPRTDRSLVLFTPDMLIASGPLTGRPVTALFPDAMRLEVEDACRHAIDGRAASFRSGPGSRQETFEASAVRTSEGVVVYGLLLSGALVSSVKPARLTPVV